MEGARQGIGWVIHFYRLAALSLIAPQTEELVTRNPNKASNYSRSPKQT